MAQLRFPSMSNVIDCANLLIKKRKEKSCFLLAVDGRDGSGKSALAHYLAIEAGVQMIDIDLFFLDRSYKSIDRSLGSIIQRQMRQKSPLIVSGIFIARVLVDLDLKHDRLVRVVRTDNPGCSKWVTDFQRYEVDFRPDVTIYNACLLANRSDQECKMLQTKGTTLNENVASCSFCAQQAAPENRSDTPWEQS